VHQREIKREIEINGFQSRVSPETLNEAAYSFRSDFTTPIDFRFSLRGRIYLPSQIQRDFS